MKNIKTIGILASSFVSIDQYSYLLNEFFNKNEEYILNIQNTSGAFVIKHILGNKFKNIKFQIYYDKNSKTLSDNKNTNRNDFEKNQLDIILNSNTILFLEDKNRISKTPLYSLINKTNSSYLILGSNGSILEKK
jgi:hypothetical protein